MNTVIYGLFCPEKQAIRYIGKSCNPEKRFKAHLYSSSRDKSTHKQRWIAGLVSKGIKPELLILEDVPDGECWESAEKRCIAQALSEGWPLTNIAAGGEGSSPLTEEARADRCAVMGKASTREKMSASAKARWADPEKRVRALNGLQSDARRAKQSLKAKARATPEYRAEMAAKTKAMWADPQKRARIIAGITPEVRAKVSAAAKRMWATTENPAVMLANLRPGRGK